MASGKIEGVRISIAIANSMVAAVILSACATQMAPTALPARPAPSGAPVPVPGNRIVPPIPPGAMIAPPRLAPSPPPADAQSLRARYGAPNFVRREADTELWRYDGNTCAVFFFLYREGDVFKVRYSETLPRGMTMAADPACVESLNGREGAKS